MGLSSPHHLHSFKLGNTFTSCLETDFIENEIYWHQRCSRSYNSLKGINFITNTVHSTFCSDVHKAEIQQPSNLIPVYMYGIHATD